MPKKGKEITLSRSFFLFLPLGEGLLFEKAKFPTWLFRRFLYGKVTPRGGEESYPPPRWPARAHLLTKRSFVRTKMTASTEGEGVAFFGLRSKQFVEQIQKASGRESNPKRE